MLSEKLYQRYFFRKVPIERLKKFIEEKAKEYGILGGEELIHDIEKFLSEYEITEFSLKQFYPTASKTIMKNIIDTIAEDISITATKLGIKETKRKGEGKFYIDGLTRVVPEPSFITELKETDTDVGYIGEGVAGIDCFLILNGKILKEIPSCIGLVFTSKPFHHPDEIFHGDIGTTVTEYKQVVTKIPRKISEAERRLYLRHGEPLPEEKFLKHWYKVQILKNSDVIGKFAMLTWTELETALSIGKYLSIFKSDARIYMKYWQ